MRGRSQRRTSPAKPSHYVAVGVALVGASIIAVTPIAPIAAPLPEVHALDVRLTSGDIVMDIVRHGEDSTPSSDLVPFYPAGTLGPTPIDTSLSADGIAQSYSAANTLAASLGAPDGNQYDLTTDTIVTGGTPGTVAGIFSGPDSDAQFTEQPFGDLEGMANTIVPGLVEVDGGIYADTPVLGAGGILYGLSTFFWTVGLLSALPILGANDYNGLVTLDDFDTAVQTIYDDTDMSVTSANGMVSDAVFSSSAATLVWVFNTVQNPDLAVLLQGLLTPNAQGVPQPFPYGSVVQVEGSPTDGWTLDSWAGTAVPDQQDMGFVGNLFLIWRDLILPPQLGLQSASEALSSVNLTAFGTAVQDWLSSEGTALSQIPGLTVSVFENLFNDVPNFVTDLFNGESLTTALENTFLAL